MVSSVIDVLLSRGMFKTWLMIDRSELLTYCLCSWRRSDGAQPQLVNIQFQKKVRLQVGLRVFPHVSHSYNHSHEYEDILLNNN